MSRTLPPPIPKRTVPPPPFPWEGYLNVKDKGNQLQHFDGHYDLPEDKIILNDIKGILETMKVSDEEKSAAASTMRLIVTYHSKKTKQFYKSSNGWLKILIPLILMNHDRPVIYNLFKAILETHVPYDMNCDRILRLLFLYHDPELAQFIVRKRVFFGDFSAEWTSSLFAGICKLETTLAIWKFLFRFSEPLIFYLIVVIVIKFRDRILNMKDDNKITISNTLAALPQYMDINNVNYILPLAEYCKKSTPFSFEYEFFTVTFNPANYQPVNDLLCLPILIDEFAIDGNKVFSKETSKSIEFVIIDCRPADQFNAGHLPNAINLDYTLHFQNPSAFADKIDALLNTQPKAEDEMLYITDLHFCFMGSGRGEDNYFTDMIIDPILEARMKYIGVLKNGYHAVHNYFREELDRYLEDHNPQICLVCNPDAAEAKSKMAKKKKKKFIKRVKKMAVQCIGKQDESPIKDSTRMSLMIDCIPNAQDFRIVSLEEYSKTPQLLHRFECQQVNEDNTEYKSYLLLTESNLHVLRLVKNHEDLAYVIAIRALTELVRMSAQKDRPELILIKFGSGEEKNIVVNEVLKFLIPNAKKIVKIISRAVLREMRHSTRPSPSAGPSASGSSSTPMEE